MSVQIINKEPMHYMVRHAFKQAYNSQVDINYSQTIRKLIEGKYVETEIPAFFNFLLDLNRDTYMIKYRSSVADLVEFYELDKVRLYDETNTYQCLKYAVCLRYNIEIQTLEEIKTFDKMQRKAMQILFDWIQDMSAAIINEIPEYKNSKWNE